MMIEFENSVRRLSFLCLVSDIKTAWINPWEWIKTLVFLEAVLAIEKIWLVVFHLKLNGFFKVQNLPRYLLESIFWGRKTLNLYCDSLYLEATKLPKNVSDSVRFSDMVKSRDVRRYWKRIIQFVFFNSLLLSQLVFFPLGWRKNSY